MKHQQILQFLQRYCCCRGYYHDKTIYFQEKRPHFYFPSLLFDKVEKNNNNIFVYHPNILMMVSKLSIMELKAYHESSKF